MCLYVHKGFFVFSRKNTSVKRTETTESILIEENEEEEQSDFPSLVEHVIPSGQEVVQHDVGVQVIPVEHAIQEQSKMWGGNCCMVILDFSAESIIEMFSIFEESVFKCLCFSLRQLVL